MNTIHSVRDQFGVAILLIEHDMNFVMGICEEITVLDYGLSLIHISTLSSILATQMPCRSRRSGA